MVSNFPREEYVILWKSIITSICKKANNHNKKTINIQGKQIMENVHMQILDQIGINRKNTCFTTLRDHKANFLKNSAV